MINTLNFNDSLVIVIIRTNTVSDGEVDTSRIDTQLGLTISR